jgi:hypothetical protein
MFMMKAMLLPSGFKDKVGVGSVQFTFNMLTIKSGSLSRIYGL